LPALVDIDAAFNGAARHGSAIERCGNVEVKTVVG